MSKYDQHVARGVELLDEMLPGWERRIDLDALRLGSCFDCVVGQVFRSDPTALGNEPIEPDYKDEPASFFTEGVKRLGVGCDYEEYGFALDGDQTFAGLTKAWKRAIRARLATPAPAATDGGDS